MKVKVDKTWWHRLPCTSRVRVPVLSFSTKALEMPPEDSLPVDVISADQLAKAMAGMKTGKKENPKPLVEKVAEAKPVEDAVGKITKKPPVMTETAPPAAAEGRGKAGREEADPPKAVEKPKEGRRRKSRSRSRRSPSRPSPTIAEAIKKEERSRRRSRCRRKPPEPQKPKIVERHFDQIQIAALLDKRDPTRQAATGDTLNSNAALGLSKGRRRTIPRPGAAMFQRQVERCWKKPYGGIESQMTGSGFQHPAEARRNAGDQSGAGQHSVDAVPESIRKRVYARSLNASRTICRRRLSTNGNFLRPCSRKKSDCDRRRTLRHIKVRPMTDKWIATMLFRPNRRTSFPE